MASTTDLAASASHYLGKLADHGMVTAAAGVAIGIAGGFMHWAVTPGLLQLAALALTVDWITGIYKGLIIGPLRSDVFRQGIVKSLIYLAIVALSLRMAETHWLFVWADDLSAGAIIGAEFISFLENSTAILRAHKVKTGPVDRLVKIVERVLTRRIEQIEQSLTGPLDLVTGADKTPAAPAITTEEEKGDA